MPVTDAYPLEIFYDGACLACANEMAYYRRRNPDQRLIFIDISAADFDAERYGRSRQRFMAELHVRDARGRFFTGADAFLALWGAFPCGSLYRFIGGLMSLPGIHLAARAGYLLFARNRQLLPRRTADCDSESCHQNHPRR